MEQERNKFNGVWKAIKLLISNWQKESKLGEVFEHTYIPKWSKVSRSCCHQSEDLNNKIGDSALQDCDIFGRPCKKFEVLFIGWCWRKFRDHLIILDNVVLNFWINKNIYFASHHELCYSSPTWIETLQYSQIF